MSFSIITDTSGNLPKRIIEQAGLEVIPFAYCLDGQEQVCTDIEAFDGESFYQKMKRGASVTTSQINPQQYIDVFRSHLAAGRDVIFVSMSSGISGSCASAGIAAEVLREEFPERAVRVIDTRGAALGEGFVALRGAKCRDMGWSFAQTADHLEAFSLRMANIFTVDDLLFLRRGGRLSNVAAVVGTVLNIKPLLKGNEDGKIVAFSKLRGRKNAIKALAERYESLVEAPQEQTVGIVNAACREDAETLASLLRQGKRPPKDILIVGYEPVTGSHVGPGALALFFAAREGVRYAN